MTITNASIKTRVERAIQLQEEGRFIVDRRSELPLPTDKSLQELKYSREWDEQGRYYDYQNVWGFFSCDSQERSLLILRKGTPPETLLPQPRLQLATAMLYAGYVSIQTGDETLEMDFKSSGEADWSTLQDINSMLKQESLPVMVWSIEQVALDTPPVIRITNESAMLFASSAIWSQDDSQLVAAHVVTTSQELLKAVKATLAQNSAKSFITVKTPEDSAFLRGAKRGFITVSNNLSQANADGTVSTLLHPLSGDPQTNSSGYFYLVIAKGESLKLKFSERLDLAIPWPIQPEWTDYLLEKGQEEGLLKVLPSCGSDFVCGLRVEKNETKWQEVIAGGLQSGRLEIKPQGGMQ